MKLKIAVAAIALLGATHAAYASPFLDFSAGLTGWTTVGDVSVLSTTDSFNINGNPFSLTPHSGESMVKIVPSGGGISGASAADAAMGLSNGTISSLLGASVTNFGLLSKGFSLAAGTYSFSWAYAANDYWPYNDGVMFAVAGNGTQTVKSLARNGTGGTDTSGPNADTLILGSYGSTSWMTASFTVATAGTYQVSFADYNWTDTAVQPVFYVAGQTGSFTGNPIVPSNVPEPASLALLGLGLAGLIGSRRKQA